MTIALSLFLSYLTLNNIVTFNL